MSRVLPTFFDRSSTWGESAPVIVIGLLACCVAIVRGRKLAARSNKD